MDRRKWGLAGLLVFEAIVAVYLLGNPLALLWAAPDTTTLSFGLSYAGGAVILAVALFIRPQRWHFAVLALLSAYRAWLQTRFGAELGVWPTWLVPIGFAWLAAAPRTSPKLAIACVALARSWFILWYVPGLLRAFGAWELVLANIIGAMGAWLWLASDEVAVGAGDAEQAPATR